jgi:uncharacterized protein (TIGR02594 family)
MTITELQKALAKAGFNPGLIDGVAGPNTRKAIRDFQASKGLNVDGIAGPKTIVALQGTKNASPKSLTDDIVFGDIPASIPWMAEAKRLIGVTETAGKGNSPTIMGWAQDAKIGYDADETPWCGLFVAHCITSTLPDEPLPKNPLGARQWRKFGVEVDPQFGATLCFWRGSVDGWMGHVGYYWAEDATTYHVLGGNQSDAVTITRMPKSRLLEARWPTSVPPLNISARVTNSAISISTKEH